MQTFSDCLIGEAVYLCGLWALHRLSTSDTSTLVLIISLECIIQFLPAYSKLEYLPDCFAFNRNSSDFLHLHIYNPTTHSKNLHLLWAHIQCTGFKIAACTHCANWICVLRMCGGNREHVVLWQTKINSYLCTIFWPCFALSVLFSTAAFICASEETTI